jgi:cell division septum initiation protein DivIVA
MHNEPDAWGGRAVTDSRMNRVKGLLAGSPNQETPDQRTEQRPDQRPDQRDMPSAAGSPHQALQVLTLAQRTADEHLASARKDAEKVRADAQAAAEQTARDAQAQAETIRRDANKMLADAREAAAQIAHDAQAHAAEVQRNADKMLAEAQARADVIAHDARAGAEELKLQAEQRYHDVVGSLAARREALQEQIEALERFDREYRSRLTAFMQGQLRALWVDQPQVNGELDPATLEPPPLAQRVKDKAPVPDPRNGGATPAKTHRSA